jgi:hypothetical protein
MTDLTINTGIGKLASICTGLVIGLVCIVTGTGLALDIDARASTDTGLGLGIGGAGRLKGDR